MKLTPEQRDQVLKAFTESTEISVPRVLEPGGEYLCAENLVGFAIRCAEILKDKDHGS